MKHIQYLVLASSILLIVACVIPGIAEPTPTPVPTNTPEPTYTPLPTDTPTPVPTSTPDKTATAVVKATEASAGVLDELEGVLRDTDIPYKQGHLLWRQSKPMSINMHGPASDFMEIDKNLTAGNFILKSDVTWNATGMLLCGAIFRSEPSLEKGRQYQFIFLRFSGLPAWAIELHEFGEFRNSTSSVQYSDALDQSNNATNQFMVIAQDEQFNVYLNKVSEGRYFDNSKQRTDGSFAFLGVQQSGNGSCRFENSWIWSLDGE